MANIDFGRRLRDLRNAKGYTQEQVAQYLGLKNKSTLGSWEIGKSEPDADTFLKLCVYYGVQDIVSTFAKAENTQHDYDVILSYLSRKLFDSYQKKSVEIQQAVCKLLDIPYIQPPTNA